jgi:hypothetical protein
MLFKMVKHWEEQNKIIFLDIKKGTEFQSLLLYHIALIMHKN